MKRRIGLYGRRVKDGDRMPWLNPSDNQGARFLIVDVRAGNAWEADREE